MKKFFILLSIIFTFTSQANAALKNLKTSSVCSLLSEYGLQTYKDWNYYDEYIGWGCNSGYKEIGVGSKYSLHNNLAFYVEGNNSVVKKVYLVLNVNNKNDAKSGHKALLEASSSLHQKVAGKHIQKSIETAIKNGHSLKTNNETYNIEVKRDNWPTGKGYEIHFIIY